MFGSGSRRAGVVIGSHSTVHWFFLQSPPADGATNMAIDHALMHRARVSGDAVLRIYAWASPVLSLGRNQLARGRYDGPALAAAGVDVVRRPTGGRALLHDREVTYSVTQPVVDGERLGEAYARINLLIVDVLRSLGIPATVAQRSGPARAPGMLPCFAEPARGEIVVGDRKLAGSAQWRDGSVLLQHGSILLDNDQGSIADFMVERPPEVPTPATLRGELGRFIEVPEIAEVFHDRLRLSYDLVETLAPDSVGVHDFLATYRDPSWTWRR